MKRSPKSIIKYLVVLTITALLFWYLFKDIPLEDVRSSLSEFNYSWILLSMSFTLLSHFLRGWRWQLLLKGSGKQVTTLNSYFAVMVGYLVNSAVPRLGEVTRCGIVNRTNKIPIAFSLGTVLTERIIDLMMLLLITAITVLLQFDLLEVEVLKAKDSIVNLLADKWWILLSLALIGLIGIYVLFFSQLSKKISLIQKIKNFVSQGIEGVISLKKLKNQRGFWLSTVAIWFLYFLMLYVITLGSDMTKDLGILAGLSILVAGSFGMASPTPNGLVTFHAFVAGILILYGIDKSDGIIFATILHTTQFVTILIFGSISLILVNTMNKSAKVGRDETENQIEEKS